MKKHLYIGCFALLSLLLSACSMLNKTSVNSDKDGTSSSESVDFQEHFFAAIQHRNNGDTKKAYAEFSKCKNLNPLNGTPHYELARIDFVGDRKEQTLAGINEAINLEPENYWYHKAHAEFLMEYAMHEDAEKELRWVIDARPDDIDSYYDLASTYLFRKEGKGAIEVYNQLEEKIGISPEITFQKQRIHLIMGNTDAALKDMDLLIAEFPDEPSFYGEKANLLFDLGRNDEAFVCLQQLLERDPENGLAHLQLSRMYAAQGKDDASWESLEIAFKDPQVSIDEKVGILLKYFNLAATNMSAQVKAKQLLGLLEECHPNDPRTHSMWGDFLVQEGKYTEARDRFALAVEEDPSRAIIWHQTISLDAQISDWKSMLMHSSEARSIFPTQPDFYLLEGNAMLRTGDAEGAVRALNTGKAYVIENTEMLASYWSSLGEAFNETKQYAKSDDAFEESIALFSNDPFVLNNYSYYLSVRNTKLARAAELSLKSNEMIPGTPSFQDTYGWILFQQGAFQEARTWLEKARDSGGESDPTILEHSGDVLFHLNQVDEAIEYWQKALDRGSKSEVLERKILERVYLAK
ncbi:MAG: tetratricopeptide (TPR) repeat protein [Flavobacteriales bacterium]